MYWRTMREELDAVNALQREHQRRQSIQSDETVASNLAQIARTAPRAPAGAAIAYARAGKVDLNDNHPLIRAQHLSKRSDVLRRERASQRPPGTRVDQFGGLRDTRSPEEILQSGFYIDADGTKVDNADQGGGGGGFMGALGLSTPFDAARSAIGVAGSAVGMGIRGAQRGGELIEQGIPFYNDPHVRGAREHQVRPAIRTASAVAEDALGLVDTLAVKYGEDTGRIAQQVGVNREDLQLAPRDTIPSAPGLRGEDLFPLARASLAADRNDAGSGYFVSGRAREQAEQQQALARGTVGGLPATFGRWTTAQYIDPDESAFDFYSGALDLFKAIGGDPANIVLSEASAIRTGRKIFELDETLDDAAKLSRMGAFKGGLKRMVHGPTVNQYLNSQSWADLSSYMAGERDFLTLWERTGGKWGAEVTEQIRNAHTPAEVTEIAKTRLGVKIREVPKLKSDFRNVFDPPRWMREIPEQQVHTNDVDKMLNAGNLQMVAGKVSRLERSKILSRYARDPHSRTNTYRFIWGRDGVLSAIGRTLKDEFGVPEEVVQKKIRSIQEEVQLTSRYHSEMSGNKFEPGGFMVDNEYHSITGPGNEAEVLNDTINFPPMREVRRRASAFYRAGNAAGNALEHVPKMPHIEGGEFVAKVLGAQSDAIDVFNRVWKPLQLVTRIAYPMRIFMELQARMAGEGLESWMNNPAAAFAYNIANSKADMTAIAENRLPATFKQKLQLRQGRGHFDFTNEGDLVDFQHSGAVRDQWEELSSPIRQAQSSAGVKMAAEQQQRIGLTRRTPIARTEKGVYPQAVAMELNKLYNGSPINREVARALQAGDLTPVLDDFWDGDLAQFRHMMANSQDELKAIGGDTAAARAAADSFIEDYVVKRLRYITGDDPNLIGVVATGELNGRPFSHGFGLDAPIDDEAKRYIRDWSKTDSAPDVIMGTRRIFGDAKEMSKWKRATGYMFDLLAARPENYLSRHPTWRQYYFQRMEELAPYVDKREGNWLLNYADANNMPQTYVANLQARIGTNKRSIPLPMLRDEAKSYALKQTNELLWDVKQRKQFFDITRFFMPFGDAWAEIIKSWVKLVGKNPRILRRGQQVVQGARGNGFFHENANGEEVFAIPGSEWLTEKITGMTLPLIHSKPFGGVGVPVALEESVQTINPGLSPAPGFGAVASIGVDHLVPDTPEWETFREIILPFGAKNYETPIDLFLPAYAQKLRAGGAFKWLGLGPSQEQLEQRKQNIIYATQFLQSTHAYDVSDDDSMRKMRRDATTAADVLMIVRGIGQGIGPGSPGFGWRVQLDDKEMVVIRDGQELRGRDIGQVKETDKVRIDKKVGQRLADLRVLGAYHRQLQREANYDSEADMQFFEEAGPDLSFVMQPTTVSSTYDLPYTDDAYYWMKDNKRFIRDNPTVYGLFAPRTGEYDFRAYSYVENSPDRRILEGDEFWRRANHRVASGFYARAREAAGPNPNQDQRRLLDQYRGQLSKDFKDWAHQSIQTSKPFLDGSEGAEQFVAEMMEAASDPLVAKTEAALAIRSYVALRAQVRGDWPGSGWATAAEGEPYRAALRDTGAMLVEKYPSFGPAWDQVFSREGDMDLVPE